MSFRTRLKSAWTILGEWSLRNWLAIRLGPEALRGAVWGMLAVTAACAVIGGLTMQTGFGYAFDFTFAFLFVAILIPLTMLLVSLLLTIARRLTRLATGLMLGSCLAMMFLWWPPELGIPMALAIGVTEGALGATIATFLARPRLHTAIGFDGSTEFRFACFLISTGER
jgi:hypothetical protein